MIYNNHESENNKADIDIEINNFVKLLLNNPLYELMFFSEILDIIDLSNSKNYAVKGLIKW